MTEPNPTPPRSKRFDWAKLVQQSHEDQSRLAIEAMQKENIRLHQQISEAQNKQSFTSRLMIFAFSLAASLVLASQFIDSSTPPFKDGILFSIRSMDASSKLAVLTALMTLGVVAVTGLVAYLNRSDRTPNENPQRNSLRREIESLKRSVSHLQSAKESTNSGGKPTPPDPSEEEAANQRVIAEVYSKLTEELMEKAQNSFHLQNIRKLHESSHNRLFQEIQKLNQRSKLNLSIGIVITMLAAAILFYIAISEPPTDTNLASLASHYVPRLSTVIFVEVFAFFFFKLYKSGLSDIRDYQQDITNLNRENCAIDLVFFSGDDNARSSIAQSLIARREPNLTKELANEIDPKLIGELTAVISKILNKTP